ncbi:MAG: GTPase HflX [Clostridia bacterium]|nr:GTPase HflX [Clostridia bacterium]
MAKNKFQNNSFEGEEKERVALIKLMTDKNEGAALASLEELWRLVETAGGEVAARIIQQKDHPDPATYIGSGKVKELAELCETADITLAVFDCELSPSQIKNLEDILGEVRVIDRSMLILDIFALHATSGEGKLQVELAQLKYTVPRLIGKGTQLSRQGGSASIAARGPGETKLETDRRYIKSRINSLERQIAEMARNRRTQRAQRDRSGIKRITIAGYTNAGKSTLLNYLTDAGILAENKLFATLDPTTRRFRLPSGKSVLLTDTVGFIRNLPHHFIKAFQSTLDEVRYADIVIVMMDASDSECMAQAEVTRELLSQLGAGEKPVLYVFNKSDIAEKQEDFTRPVLEGAEVRDVFFISAKTGRGIDKLLSRIDELVPETTYR